MLQQKVATSQYAMMQQTCCNTLRSLAEHLRELRRAHGGTMDRSG
jgi:hypothetical protein